MSLAVNTIQFFMDDQSPYVNKSSFLLRDLLGLVEIIKALYE
jgi:hypothetical protein